MDYVLRDLRMQALNREEFRDDPNGRLLIFNQPNRNRKYYMGVDVGSGIGLTNSVIHVLEEGTLHDPDEQAAEFACDFLNPHELAAVIHFVGQYYYSDIDDLPALAAIEINNQGESCQYDLMTYYRYPNIYIRQALDRVSGMQVNKYGWQTTAKTRPRIVQHGHHQLKRKQWIINSPWFIDEMADFTTRRAITSHEMDLEKDAVASGKAKVGAKDDRLMAGFIAVWTCHEFRVLTEDPAVARSRKDEEIRRSQEELQNTGQKKDFQNSPISYKEMMDQYY